MNLYPKHLIILFLSLSIFLIFVPTALGGQEQLFSWSGVLPANPSLSEGTFQHFSTYLRTSEKVKITLSAPETVDVYIQSSDDYSKSAGNGWWAIYYQYKTTSAELDQDYSVPFTDTWYFTIRNLKHNEISTVAFQGTKYVADPTIAPTPKVTQFHAAQSDSSLNLSLLIGGAIIGAIIAALAVTVYFTKTKKKID